MSERPGRESGGVIPHESRSVGTRSTRLVTSWRRPPPSKPGPQNAVGTRTDAS